MLSVFFFATAQLFWLYSPIPPPGIEAEDPKFLIEIVEFKLRVLNLAALIRHAFRSY